MNNNKDLDQREIELRIKNFAIASSINGIAIGNLDGVITYVNDAVLKLWGTNDSSEIIGKSATIFAESQQQAADILQAVLEKGSWMGEASGKTKDGLPVTILLSASLVRDDSGNPICMTCSYIDITERKLIEEELKIKESAIAYSINGIGIGDLNGNIIYINEAGLKMWGSDDPSEVIGRSVLEFADSPDEALSIFNDFLAKGAWSGDVKGRKKDGSTIIVHLSASIVRNDKGEPICTMNSFLDVTERKKMEEDLRIKDLAVSSSIDGIGISDIEGNILYMNEAAFRMWGGQDISEALGTSIFDLARSKEEAIESFKSILENGSWSGDIEGYKKDGSIMSAHVSASLVKDEKGDPIYVMGSYVDITERKLLEENLRIKDLAIASSIVGFAITDFDGNIVYANDAALKMFGAEDNSDVIGASSLSMAQSPEEAATIRQIVLEKGSWTGEISGFKKDGSPGTVYLSANLVKNGKGDPIYGITSFVDITERKHMENELRVKDFAIASSLNGIIMGDLNGNITYVNDSFMHLWGGENVSEVIGKPVLNFIQSKDEANRIIHSVVNKGHWMGELIAKRKDFKPVALQITASIVKNNEDKPLCFMCSFVDVTERKITEQKLQKSYENLEQRVTERTEELVKSNIRLKREIEERKQAEHSLIQKEEELSLKSLHLEEANTALKVLLKRGEQDKNELEEKVLTNIKELALPYIEKLKTGHLDDRQRTFVEILESNLNDIVSPFLRKLSAQYLNLTPTEIQIANLIREGKSSKEIGDLMSISERAIEFHRNNIRDKLGLKKSKTNLRTYLMTLS